MDEFRKSFAASFDDINPGSREVVAVISTDDVDRDGEVLLPKGLRKKNYAGIVVDFNHDHDKPIGTCRWVKSEPSRIIAKYRISDKTELSRDVFSLIQDGILKYHSVEGRSMASGKPTDADVKINKAWASAKRLVRDWELFGFAVCAQPVNPEAVAMLIAKGYSSETIQTFTGGAAIPEATPVIEKAIGVRTLTTGEVVVAITNSMNFDGMSVRSIIAKAMGRAAGKLD